MSKKFSIGCGIYRCGRQVEVTEQQYKIGRIDYCPFCKTPTWPMELGFTGNARERCISFAEFHTLDGLPKVRFEIGTSVHQQYCIERTNLTEYEHWFLRRALSDNMTNSEFYRKRQSVSPFFQGGSDQKSGWALIEFWTSNFDACVEYVTWLNNVYPETILEAERLGILKFGKRVVY